MAADELRHEHLDEQFYDDRVSGLINDYQKKQQEILLLALLMLLVYELFPDGSHSVVQEGVPQQTPSLGYEFVSQILHKSDFVQDIIHQSLT